MALDSTISGANSNSYIGVAEADAFFEFHPDGTAWFDLTISQKEIYLVTGSNRLDQLKYSGKPTSTDQRMQWPREFCRNRDYAYLDDGYRVDLYFESSDSQYYLPSDEIPKEVVDAVCEMAIHYKRKFNEEYDLTDIQYETYSKLNVGGVSLELRDGLTDDRLPTKVKRILRSIGPKVWASSSSTLTMVRG